MHSNNDSSAAYDEKLEKISRLELNEQTIARQIRKLFSRSLKHSGKRIYLANHSLGRALDQTEADVLEGLSHWYRNGEQAWRPWLAEMDAFRNRIARLIHAPRPDCIIPKTSAGQGLRAILNCYERPLRVITSHDEFNSIDHILKVYAAKGRIDLHRLEPDRNHRYRTKDLIAAMSGDVDLMLVSMVFFTTGQLLDDIPQLVGEAKRRGIKLFLDLYHAAGVLPVDVAALDIDFAVGGGYKYLHGGPGACWLYLHPRHLDGSLQTLDSGWFAQPDPMRFERSELPAFAEGGNRFLESTPAILPFYQARAGLKFTLTLGVERLRQYTLEQQRYLECLLRERHIDFFGSIGQRGAFLAMPVEQAERIAAALKQQGIICDARAGFLRFGPDLLNTRAELQTAVERLAELNMT